MLANDAKKTELRQVFWFPSTRCEETEQRLWSPTQNRIMRDASGAPPWYTSRIWDIHICYTWEIFLSIDYMHIPRQNNSLVNSWVTLFETLQMFVVVHTWRSPRTVRTPRNWPQLFTKPRATCTAPTRKSTVPNHVAPPTRLKAKLNGSWNLNRPSSQLILKSQTNAKIAYRTYGMKKAAAII